MDPGLPFNRLPSPIQIEAAIEGLQGLVHHQVLVRPQVQAAKALVAAIEVEPLVDKMVEPIAPLAAVADPAWAEAAAGAVLAAVGDVNFFRPFHHLETESPR